MLSIHPSSIRFLRAPLLCCGAVLWVAAHAAPAPDTAQQRYARDRQACLSGQTTETRATCLREADAARQAARTGQLSSDETETYRRNALQRCDVFKSHEDHMECVGRITGRGTTSGSVEEGGILRELETQAPAHRVP